MFVEQWYSAMFVEQWYSAMFVEQWYSAMFVEQWYSAMFVEQWYSAMFVEQWYSAMFVEQWYSAMFVEQWYSAMFDLLVYFFLVIIFQWPGVYCGIRDSTFVWILEVGAARNPSDGYCCRSFDHLCHAWSCERKEWRIRTQTHHMEQWP